MYRLFFTILLSVQLVCFAQQAEFLWAKKLGGPNAFNCRGRNIIADSLGNIYLAGYFYSTVDFDPGAGTANLSANNLGGYLAKYDSLGNYQWAFKIGKYVYTVLFDDSLNIHVSGTFYGKTDFDMGPDTAYLSTDTNEENIFVAKYTSNMEFIWARSISGSFGELTNTKIISLDKPGNIFIAGQFEDTAYFNNLPDTNYLVAKGWINAFIAKYDVNGNFLWARSIEGQDNSVSLIPGIVTDTEGNCYITGMIAPEINNDFDPGPDTAYLTTTGTYDDGFVAKYDADGNYIWAFAIDGGIQVKSYTITTDRNNDIYIAGSIVGDADFDPDTGIANLNPVGNYYTPFFAKYDSAGNYLFAKKITSYGTDEIFNIEVDSSGKIAVVGYFTDSTADFDPGPNVVNLIFTFNSINNYDAFWAVYDSLGNYILAQSMYGNDETVAHDVSFYKNNLLVTGHFNDTMYFDNTAPEYLVSVGMVQNTENVFFAKYRLDFTSGLNSINANSKSIKIYPNPTSGKFMAEITNPDFMNLAYRQAGYKITIYNILGKKVYHSTFNFQSSGGQHSVLIDLSDQPAGIYFYQISAGEKIYSEKLVKE